MARTARGTARGDRARPAAAASGQTWQTWGVTTLPERGGDTLTEEVVDYRMDEGDHERFAHYARRDQQMQSMIEGTPLRALCGKIWVPSRDPKRFPVCPECKEIYESLPKSGP